MTAIAIRFPSRQRDPANSRFGRTDRVQGSIHLSDSEMTTKMEAIRALIERDAYRVDSAKVADAIIARLMAGSPTSR